MTYTTTQINDSIKRVKAFIDTNKRRPNTIKVGSNTLTIANYLKLAQLTDAKTRLDKFIKSNGRYPNTLQIGNQSFTINQYKILYGITVITNRVSDDEVFNYFVKVFGQVNTIEEVLSKIRDRGYKYYYNDVYTNKTSIDRLKNKQGINCTDSCGVVYRVAKALGYEVRCMHVQCQSGGHVRLQVRKGNQSWKNIDPACVISANAKPITCIWCPSAKLIDIDPKWFIDNTKR